MASKRLGARWPRGGLRRAPVWFRAGRWMAIAAAAGLLAAPCPAALAEDVDITANTTAGVNLDAQAGTTVRVYPGVILSNQATVMPGGTLTARIGAARAFDRNAVLAVGEGLILAIQHLRGLEFVHRDIKPANIMMQGTTPRLADFGISRVMKTNSASQNAAGTPFYMAPEAFDRKRNAQTDIWAIGVILYQMVSGRLPFPSEDVTELVAAIVMNEPAPLPAEIPNALQEIVDKALSKDPRHRYQTASQMREDLNAFLYRILPLSSGKTETIKVATVQSDQRGLSKGGKKAIAILPFKNLNGDSASQFYEFSLADAVITELARLRSLIVRPSSVIAKYQNKDVDARQAGKEMRVDSVLAAAFIFSGNRFRVTAQLVDVSSGDIIWSDRIDCDAQDVFLLQDTITQRIVEGLRLDLTTGEQELFGQRLTNNIEAYEEYLRGRDKFARFIFRTLLPSDCEAAIKSFERAVELDPQFALAWSGIGACYGNKVFKALGGMDDYIRAESALSRAIELDPTLVEPRVVRSFIYGARGEKEKVRSEIDILSKQFPNHPAVFFLNGVTHRISGEYDQSLACFERLERLDPTSTVSVCSNRARIYSMQGHHERALEELERGEAVEPAHPFIKVFRAQVLFNKGEVREAELLLSTVLAEHPHLVGVRPLLAMFLASQNKRSEALENLTDQIRQKASADYDISYWTACAYSLLGETDLAFDWLERSIMMGLTDTSWFRTDPSLKNLRDDPRFELIMNRIADT